MRTKPIWNKKYKVVWKWLPENKRTHFKIGDKICIPKDWLYLPPPVLIRTRNPYKFYCRIPIRRVSMIDSIWQ